MYLFDKILEYKERYINSKEKDESVAWALDNCLEEFLEILSYYNLNCKN